MLRRPVASVLLLALPACVHLPAPASPRPPLPLPASVAARYRLPGPVQEIALVPLGADGDVGVSRGIVACGEERARFRLLEPAAEDPAPLVLLLPILAGGENLLWTVGLELAERGYVVAWVDRAGGALRRGQRGHDLEHLLRRTIRHDRMVLRWARRQPSVDAGRTACVGISMGGMVGTALLAVEPELRGGALVLAGGDLAELVFVSSEGRAVRWREWRLREDGIGVGELHREIRRELVSDPVRLGPYVATERVLLVGGRFDRVVPPSFQDRLWESLGRPERWLVPTGHYGAALMLPGVIDRVDGFLRRRFAAPGAARRTGRPVSPPSGRLSRGCASSGAPVSSLPRDPSRRPP